MIAYAVRRTLDSSFQRQSPAAYEVVVVDTAGRRLAGFPRAVRLAWSPAGDTLAVAIARTPWETLSGFDSIYVWSPRAGIFSQAQVSARRGPIGWAGPDTVLAGSWVQGPVDAIPLRTGAAAVSKHHGTDVSPDGLFSIYPTFGGLGVGVYEDRTGANYAYRSVELLRFPRLGEIGPARWVRSSRSGHALAISACPLSDSSPTPGRSRRNVSNCLTAFVDAGSERLLGWTHGRLIGLSSNGGAAVVERDTSFAFVGDSDWERGPVPKQPYPWKERGPVVSGPARPVLAFTMDQIRCCDNGRFPIALGYHPGLVYTVWPDGQTRLLPRHPSGYWASEAALNRTGDLIAITCVTGDSERRPSVLVADTSGAIVETFSGKARFRWNRDGTRLALIGKDVTIWDRRKGVTSKILIGADDESWSASGILMLRSHDRVLAFDPRSGDTTSTRHMAVDLSPDGRYSIDGVHYYAGTRVFDDRMQANITSCGWGEVSGLAGNLSADPFWSLAPDEPHHLWVNRCDSRFLGLEEGKLAGCDMALIDVDRMELVDAIEGKLLGRTADGRCAVVLRGSKFIVISLEPRTRRQPIANARTAARRKKAVLQAVVLQWSSWRFSRQPAKDDTVGVYRVDAEEGGWLPEWPRSGQGCGRGMKVRKVSDTGSVEIEYSSGRWNGSGTAVVVPESETRLTTNSSDGGYSLHLRVVR